MDSEGGEQREVDRGRWTEREAHRGGAHREVDREGCGQREVDRGSWFILERNDTSFLSEIQNSNYGRAYSAISLPAS